MGTLFKMKNKLFDFAKPYLWSIIISIILLLTVSGLSLMGPIIIKRLIDVDIANCLKTGIFFSAGMYVAVQMAMLATRYIQMNILQKVGTLIMCDIKLRLFSHILRLPVTYFEKNPAGKLISRIESDTETLRQLFTNTAVTLFQDILVFAGMLCVMFYLSARLTLILLCILPFLFVGAFYIQRALRTRFKAAREKASMVSKFLSEYIQGMLCVQAFNYENSVEKRMLGHNNEKKETFYHAETLEIIFHNSILLAEAVTLSFVLYYGGFMALDKTLTLGTLVLFIGYIRQCFEPIIRLSEQFNIIQKAKVAGERIFEILALEREDAAFVEAVSRGGDGAGDLEDAGESCGFNDEIEFRDVSFSYDGTRPILSGVSFRVKKGESVALVGHTGSGKTTILSLLLKFYRASSGRISIDGKDINEIAHADLRRKFALVLQDVTLFPGKIIDNIRLLNEGISREKVVEASRAVNMLNFIDGRDRGFDTEVAERGANFSMGERQLMSFARALAFDPEILVLDEATSSVDPYTEALIQDALYKIQKGRTSIVVAHRLSTIVNADRIIVLESGRIVEMGNHAELFEKNGIYRKLYEKQMEAEGAKAPGGAEKAMENGGGRIEKVAAEEALAG